MRQWFRYGVLAGIGNLALAVSGATAEPVTIVVLGDSLTAGYGLRAEEGFVPQMQAWLEAQEVDAVVINAGVSGDTTAGGLARLDWAMDPAAEAMIVALGGNDYLRAIDPDTVRENLAAIVARVQDAGLEVLLVGIVAGSNYGPEYATEFNAIYTDLAEETGADLRRDFFAGLAEEQAAGALRDYMQADGIHPNAQGVREIVADLGPAVAELAARAAE